VRWRLYFFMAYSRTAVGSAVPLSASNRYSASNHSVRVKYRIT
jgi:hypothetical protein